MNLCMRDDGSVAQTDPTNMNAAENAAELATVAASKVALSVSSPHACRAAPSAAFVALGTASADG